MIHKITLLTLLLLLLSSPIRRIVAGPELMSGMGLPTRAPVLTGLDVLEREGFRRLQGRRVGLVCNQTAVDRRGRHIVDVMAGSASVHLVALFAPEHGIRGVQDTAVRDSRDSLTGLRIFSLYNDRLPGAQRYRPTPEMLRGIDTLVFDIQDIGARYYTYISTLGYLLETAAKYRIKVIVLDRPNPLGGLDIAGPNLEWRYRSFAGYHNMPITHGMTVGELAKLFNTERKIGADVEVVAMENWNRQLLFDETGLPWVKPSPNIRSVTEAALYSGIGFLEDLPLSVGRGTSSPFEIVGAPWISGSLLANHLNARRLPGVLFHAVRFVPGQDRYAGRLCGGVRIEITNRRFLRALDLGIHVADALARLYPHRLCSSVLARMRPMIGNAAIPDAIARGVSPSTIVGSWSGDTAGWRLRRAPFLLYPV